MAYYRTKAVFKTIEYHPKQTYKTILSTGNCEPKQTKGVELPEVRFWGVLFTTNCLMITTQANLLPSLLHQSTVVLSSFSFTKLNK